MEKLRANEFYESGQLSKPAPIMVLETIIRLCDEDNDLIKKVAELGITLWLADVERHPAGFVMPASKIANGIAYEEPND